MTDSIVRFTSPPVVEVVAGVSFTGYDSSFGPVLAAFWKEILRSRFPELQQQPPYVPPEEIFNDQPAMGGVMFQFVGQFSGSRLWATAEDGNELLQLQPDWFARNWRKVNVGDEYDQWPARRAALASSLAELSQYLTSSGFKMPTIRQCEVSYVNHISLEGVSGGHGGIGQVLKGQDGLSGPFPVEQATVQAKYILENELGPIGRLHVSFNPALDAAGKPIYVLELTARGKPDDPSVPSALAFLDRGREAINAAFVGLTTTEMHQAWGLKR